MDDASCHRVEIDKIPTMNSDKSVLQEWLATSCVSTLLALTLDALASIITADDCHLIHTILIKCRLYLIFINFTILPCYTVLFVFNK